MDSRLRYRVLLPSTKYGRNPANNRKSTNDFTIHLSQYHVCRNSMENEAAVQIGHRISGNNDLDSIGYLFTLPFLLYCMTLRYPYVMFGV